MPMTRTNALISIFQDEQKHVAIEVIWQITLFCVE